MAPRDEISPPAWVRLLFWLRMPVPGRWKSWALDRLEDLYGAEPSESARERTIVLGPDPMNPQSDIVASAVPLSFPRNSEAQKKASRRRTIEDGWSRKIAERPWAYTNAAAAGFMALWRAIPIASRLLVFATVIALVLAFVV